MKKDDFVITEKKTLEAILEELQYTNSELLVKLEKGSDLYSNISSIDIKVKNSHEQISKISKILPRLYQDLNNSIVKIANEINFEPIEDKIIKMVTFDGGRLRNMIDKMHKDLVISLRDAMMTVEDFEKQKRDILSLKKYLKYVLYSNSLLFVAVVLLIYKI